MRWKPPTAAILIGCLATAAFNSLGWLPISEHKLYDYYLRSRLGEPQDKKVVIVGLNEKDIEKLGFPISDDTLATLLTLIKAQNPRAIGLDLHRNLVNTGAQGNQKLNNILSSTPELIGVEKTDGGNPNHLSISAAGKLKSLGQTGASEIIEDGVNGVVRRGYLYVQKSTQSEPIPSLGLAVALKYLEGENIFPTGYGDQSWLKLNNAVFPMLEANRLFYNPQAIDNYQTIINYYNPKDKFLRVSISEVLENKIDNNLFENKIVFIGTTAETIKDIYTTPYSYHNSENYDLTYGVEVHASMTSQIVNAAKGDLLIIKFLPFWWQYSGLFILLITTSFSCWYLYTKNSFFTESKIVLHIICSIFSLIIILVLGYLLLLNGWWFPTATALLLSFSSEVWIYIFIRLDQLRQENLILEQKVEQRTQALKKAQKKILSQEKLAIYQKLAQYIAHEIKNKTNIIGLTIENSQAELDELELIVEDNLFFFEELDEPGVKSPREIIKNLNSKLLRIKSVNQKVTWIINEIYHRGTESNNDNYSVKTEVDLNQLLDPLLSDARQICQIKYPNFQLVIERNYALNLHKLSCITSEIERAFDNIISNAVYYLYQKKAIVPDYHPQLSISTRNRAKAIEIKIRDNGTGIKSENKERIFQRFWTTKTCPEGLGLGLYFAKESVEKHGGKISVDSIEDEYTEFTVILPTKSSNQLKKSQ